MKLFIVLLCASLFVASSVSFGQQQGSGIAIIELFTSEGCSSCPAAERLLGEIAAEGKSNIFTLEYHVDYWNYLGWKDEFSSAEYSKRQREYSGFIPSSSIYTPQAVVNGSREFVGSDKSALQSAITQALKTNEANKVKVETKRANASVKVAYSISGALTGKVLHVALLQKNAVTNVRRGENNGRKLMHTNVVRAFNTLDLNSPTGETQFTLPGDVLRSQCLIVAFVQDRKTGSISGATKAVL